MNTGVRSLVLSTAIAAGLIAPQVFADNMADRARQAGDAHRFGDFNAPTMEGTLAIEVDESPPEANLRPHNIESRALEETAGDSLAARHYGTVSGNLEGWSEVKPDAALFSSADLAVSQPSDLLKPDLFSASGDDLACTTDDVAAAPSFMRTCDRVRETFTSTCTDLPTVVVPVTQDYACKTTDAEDGCAELVNSGICTPVERICETFDGSTCLSAVETHACTSETAMRFAAVPVGLPVYGEPSVLWETACAPNYVPEICTPMAETCGGTSTVKYIEGHAVPLDCDAVVTNYECVADTYNSDCKAFTESGACELTEATCLLKNVDGVCGTYEDTYTCGGSVDEDFSQCAAVNVCIDGTCNSIPNETSDAFPKAAAYIGIANNMSNNWRVTKDITKTTCVEKCAGTGCGDSQDGMKYTICKTEVIERGGILEFFSGGAETCRRFILSALNCCTESGWAEGVLGDCREDELKLVSALQAGTTKYMRTYCSKKALFICLVKKREYCVFNSKLARVFNAEVQRVLGKDFKCRPLTRRELEVVDFSKVNMAPVFADMLDSATVPDPALLNAALVDNIEQTVPFGGGSAQ